MSVILLTHEFTPVPSIRVYIQANSKFPIVYSHFWRKKKQLLRKFQLFETFAVQGNLLRQYLIVICRFSNIKKEINSGELGHSSGGVFFCKTHYIWNCRSKGGREGGALSNWSESKRISLKNCWQYLANKLWIMFFYLFVMNSLCYIQRQYGREVCDFFFL